MEPYISGSEEEVRRREVYMYYGLLVKVAELKLFTSELKLRVKGFRIYKPNSPAQPGGHSPKEPKPLINKALSPKPWCHSAK